jgi:phosphoglycolate phosphatase-like HAD superfamily hydrolase
MTVQGVIFDIDGTLIDSVHLHVQARQEALRHFGYASSAKGDELKKYGQIAGIDDLAKDETSAAAVDRSKASPDAIEAALSTLHHTDPESIMMIGDTRGTWSRRQKCGYEH